MKHFLRLGLLKNMWSDKTVPLWQKLLWIVDEEGVFSICILGIFVIQIIEVDE